MNNDKNYIPMGNKPIGTALDNPEYFEQDGEDQYLEPVNGEITPTEKDPLRTRTMSSESEGADHDYYNELNRLDSVPRSLPMIHPGESMV